jgi:tRNA(adenine34) deaminase
LPNFSNETLEAAMQAALAEAGKAAAAGEFPYGAVVVASDGEIIARAQDRVVRDNDPTMHAEIEAVRAAIRILGPDLSGHALVSNVEACAMCATAAWGTVT